ncbi:MAG: AMP-binding protein, partial [Vicinamibacterales bacterium]
MRPPRTIGQALFDSARSSRGLRFIEHDGQMRYASYQTLLDEALSIGGALQARGFHTGDRVALIVPDVSGFVKAFFGIVAAGLVPVPLCPPAQAGDLGTFAVQSRHILSEARAAGVVTTIDVAPFLDDAMMSIADGHEAVGVGTSMSAGNDGGPFAVGYAPPAARQPRIVILDDLLLGPSLATPFTVPTDGVALLQYTSGSTALPKGVVLTHANISANVAAIVGPGGLDARPGDVAVSWLPLYHDMGLIGMLLSSVYEAA